MTDEELIEAVARVIDPSSWRVMDSYLAQTKRKYRGQNVGWPADQYQHKESMAIARVAIPVAQAPLLARIAKLEAVLGRIIEQDQQQYSYWQYSKATSDRHLREGVKDGPSATIARNALRSTQ